MAKNPRTHIPLCGSVRCANARTWTAQVSAQNLCSGCLTLLDRMETLLLAAAVAVGEGQRARALADIRAWAEARVPDDFRAADRAAQEVAERAAAATGHEM